MGNKNAQKTQQTLQSKKHRTVTLGKRYNNVNVFAGLIYWKTNRQLMHRDFLMEHVR